MDTQLVLNRSVLGPTSVEQTYGHRAVVAIATVTRRNMLLRLQASGKNKHNIVILLLFRVASWTERGSGLPWVVF